MTKTSEAILGFQPQWKNIHAPDCPVTKERIIIWDSFVADPTNEALFGAVKEYDHYGDQETENCTCGFCGRGYVEAQGSAQIIDECDICGDPITREQMGRFEYREGGQTATRSIHESCAWEGTAVGQEARILALAVNGFRKYVEDAMGKKDWDEGGDFLNNQDLIKIASDLRDLADLWDRG